MKELNLEESRIKKVRGKSIESLFRTLSKNHYRMLQMVDRKASILISVNAIIISIIVSVYYSGVSTNNFNHSIMVLMITSPLSLLIGLSAIRPFVLSSFSIGLKDNKLVNIEAIKKMSISDYKTKMNNVLQDDNTVYDAMTEDIYFIGKNIYKKHIHLGWSAFVFIAGQVLAIILLLFFN